MRKLVDSCRNSSGRLEDQFVGIKFGNHDLEVVFPYGYDIPRDEKSNKDSIKSLLLSFSLSKEMYVNNKTVHSNNFGDEIIPFASFFWLITDYLNNGFYLNKQYDEKNNINGKIYWKKTISNNSIFSKKGVFFPKIVVKKSNNYESILTKIHMFSINLSLSYIGFLYPNTHTPKNHININSDNCSYYAAIVEKEIHTTFVDRNILLLRHLKKILLSLENSSKQTSLVTFGVRSYELVWERLLKYHFSNRDESSFYPFASWYILNREKYVDSYLRPDSVMQINNNLFILDAKYYQYGINDEFYNLPHTDSIQKQITYGEYASKIEPNMDDIHNAFLMPYNKNINNFGKNGDISIIGYAKSGWEIPKTKYSYATVYAVLLDTKFIVDTFAQRNTKLKPLLAKKIIDANNEFKSKSYIE